jgi:hypothetical protein
MSGAHCAGERDAVAGREARRHIADMAMTKLLIERSSESEVVDATAVARARWWRRAIAWARAGFRTPAIGATLPTTLVLEDNVAMSLHVRELPFSIRCVEGASSSRTPQTLAITSSPRDWSSTQLVAAKSLQ